MSVPVDLDALRAVVDERGLLAFLVTVGPEGPHVVSAQLHWDGADLTAAAGRKTTANLAQQPAATLLWPAGPTDEHSLLVDGTATVHDDRVVVTPSKAILHRRAGDEGGPRCEPVT
jgi:hypothetical protein